MSKFSDASSNTTFVGIGHQDGRTETEARPIFRAEQKKQQENSSLLRVGADSFIDADEAHQHGPEAVPGAWQPVGQLVKALLNRLQKDE